MQLVPKIKVIASSAVTWLTFAVVVLTMFSEEIAALLPAESDVTTWIATAVVWLSAAIAIIRRVTPVIPEERGILPQSPPPVETVDPDAPLDEGAQ